MTELIWDGKYKDGKKQGPVRIVLPMSEEDPRSKTFTYEGYDIITLKKEIEREYAIPEPQTAQEVIG